MLVDWLTGIGAFWTITALYLGGGPVAIEGGSGARQLLGLMLAFAIYLAIWRVLDGALVPALGHGAGLILATALSLLLLPVIAWTGMRLTGTHVRNRFRFDAVQGDRG